MKFFIAFALVAAAAAQISNEYLPPNAGGAVGGSASYAAESVEVAAPATSYDTYDVAEAAPAHSFSEADGYRYKTHRRRVVRRQRRDLSSEYLPPVGISEAVPEVVYTSAPTETYESADFAAPAHTFSETDGYRYKTQRRRVVKTVRRNRRDVSSEYLPPVAASEEVAYAAAPSESYETADATPAHSFSDADGYRYKTHRRRVIRRNRRDVSSEYLPPVAASEEVAYAAAPSESYETADATPAHSFSDADGYRYKTHRRRVIRRNRRDVSSEYLPPVAASEEVAYAAAPSDSFEAVDAAPAHSFSDADGYRYKTHRRRVVRRQRRDVSSEYLPPVASNSAQAVSYEAPVASVESYDVAAAAAPAHSFSEDDGYRYKTQRRRVVVRRNRF